MKYLSLSFGLLLLVFVFSFYQSNRKNHTTQPGKQLIYKYQSEGIGYSDAAKLYSTDTTNSRQYFFSRSTLQTYKLNISCTISKTVLEENKDGQVAAFVISEPDIQLEAGGVPMDTKSIQEDICRPVFTQINKQGLIKNLQIDSSINYLSSNFIKDILSHIQYSKPLTKLNKWKVSEEVPSGISIAHYSFIKDSAGFSKFERSNNGDIKIKSQQKDQRLNTDCFSDILIDSTGELNKINISGTETTLFGNDTIAVSGNKVGIELISSGISVAEDIKTLTELAGTSKYSVNSFLSSELSDDAITKMAYTNTLKDDTWETLTGKIDTLKESSVDETEIIFLKLRALAYLAPENCSKIAARLTKEPYNSNSYRLFSRALSATGTTSSINSIADIIAARQSEEAVAIDLLPVIATSGTPTIEAADIVKQLAFDTGRSNAVRSTAQLTLAAMAYNFKGTNKSKAGELSSFIIEKMENETDSIQKILVLSNTGSASILPFLRSIIDGKQVSAQVRSYAIQGLRLIKNNEVEKFLTRLENSKDSAISNTAKEIIEFRKENTNK